MKSKLMGFVLSAMFASTGQAALTIHKAPPQATKAPIPVSNNPEDQLVNGRARSQRLEDAMLTLTRNRMSMEYATPSLKDMPVNWRSNNEPLQIILTNLGRGYGIDVVINEAKETVYLAVDTGQCDAVRERELLATKAMWEAMNINDLPQLPPRLASPVGISGHEYRLC